MNFFFVLPVIIEMSACEIHQNNVAKKTIVLNVHFMRKCRRSHPKTTPSRFYFVALFSCDGTFCLSCLISTLWLQLQTSSEHQRQHGYSERVRFVEREITAGGACQGQFSARSFCHEQMESSTTGGSIDRGLHPRRKHSLREGRPGRFEGQIDGQEPWRGSAELALGGGVNGTAERSPSSGVPPRKHGARVCVVTPICLSR